ncbi:MAG: UDP-glucose 4-epimerase [Pseudomonadota bacterium]|jgi:UDP-glucose 4-epimerase
MQRILLTGASGFVGRVVLQRALEAGHQVTLAVRRPLAEPHPRARTVRVGEIDESTRWEEALEGVTTVIHAAGRAHIMGEAPALALPLFRRINRGGTERLAREAARLGVSRFVFVSSIKVNGDRTSVGRPFTESDPPCPGDPYAISKWEAEQVLQEIAAGTGLSAAVVRPPLVFGPGVRANFRSLMRWVERGLPLPLGALRNRRSLVGVQNLADLLLTCARHERAAGELFLAADQPAVSTSALVTMLSHAFDRPPVLLPVPETALRLAGRALGRSAAVARLCDSLEVDSSKASRLLDFAPALSLEQGLQAAVQGYRRRAGSA